MMGIFPDCPGSTSYQLTSPVFDEIEIELNQDFYPGEKLIISTEKSAQDDVLIDQIKYNGNPWMRFSIDHQELTKGGTLAFQLKNAE
jgi:putative alpha-1,2-mannosidase